MSKTLSQIEEGARQRSDMEDDGNFVSSAEVTAYANASIQTFWDFLIGEDSGTLFAKEATLLNQLGTNRYELPSDFYRLMDVSVKNSSIYYSCTPADPQEYAQLLTANLPQYASTKYFLKWNMEYDRFEIDLFPATDPDNIFVRYIPNAPTLSLAADPLNLPDSWCEWIMLDVAIKMASKEETDTSTLEQLQMKLEARILDAINEINKTGIKTIRQIDTLNLWNRLPAINVG